MYREWLVSKLLVDSQMLASTREIAISMLFDNNARTHGIGAVKPLELKNRKFNVKHDEHKQ